MSCACNSGKCDCKSVPILSKLLANSYVLFVKTQNVHWNVESKSFRSIHLMTEEHYNDLFSAIDVIAERIRMVGAKAPATFSEFLDMASFDDKLSASTASNMIKELLIGHETIRNDIKCGLSELSDSSDFATIDVLNQRLAYHEKVIWMLKSTIVD